jgi:hypothetical protein
VSVQTVVLPCPEHPYEQATSADTLRQFAWRVN